MNTQLPGPRHARADVGRAHRGRSLLAAAAASFLALTGLSGIALASDEDETPTPSTSASSLQTNATEGTPPDETQPTGDAGTISSGTAGGASTATDESATLEAPAATADPEVEANSEAGETTPSKTPTSIQTRELQLLASTASAPWRYWMSASVPVAGNTVTEGDTITYTLNAQRTGRRGSVTGAVVTLALTGAPSSSVTLSSTSASVAISGQTATWSPSSLGATASQVAVTATIGTGATAGTLTAAISDGGDPNGSFYGSSAGTTRYETIDHTVQKAVKSFSCAAGTVYSVSSNGRIYEVTTSAQGAINATASNVGDADGWKSSVSTGAVNALAITQGGTAAYAIDRTHGDILKYDSTNGYQMVREDDDNAKSDYIVAGGISPNGGGYYFGYYDTLKINNKTNTIFRLFMFDTTTNSASVPLGFVIVATTTANSNNGDLAFDSTGTLYLVWSTGGSSPTNQVIPIPRSSLEDAENKKDSTTQITSSPTTALGSTFGSYNGIAFDSSGQIFVQRNLGTSNYNNLQTIIEYADPQSWDVSKTQRVKASAGNDYLSGSYSGTDLASCAYPPTLTVKKDVVDRYHTSDQFTLQVERAGTSGTVASGTTIGSDLGVQGVTAGPIPAVVGDTYTVSEVAGSAGTSLSNYVSSWACTNNGTPVTDLTGVVTTGDKRSANVTIPAATGGQPASVECTVTNSPKFTTLTLVKSVDNSSGGAADPADWTLAAKAAGDASPVINEAPSIEVLNDPNALATQTVRIQDNTPYALSESGSAKGYLAGQWSCAASSGTAPTVSVNGTSTTVSVAPGVAVTCSIRNTYTPGSATWSKTDDQSSPTLLGGSKWTLTSTDVAVPVGTVVDDCATGASGTCDVGAYKDQDPVAGRFRLAGLAWGTYTLTESKAPDGYVGGRSFSFTVSASNAGNTISLGAFQNTRILGTVTWSKVAAGTSNLLSGSEWTLKGPGAGGVLIPVTDCVPTDTSCSGPDLDPAAGKFRVSGLDWGSYTLTETKAPAGFVVSGGSPWTFTIGVSTGGVGVLSTHDLGSIENEQRQAVTLPLTGGLGTDTFLLAGGGLLALAGIGGWIHRRRSLRVQRA